MPGAGRDARLWFCFYQILKGSAPSRAMPTQLRRARPMKTKRKGMSYAKWGYIFLAPFFITFFIFQFWPLATTIYYSFFEYFRSGLKIIGPNFVGLKNYAAMIQEVPKYFSNTMIMWLMGFIPQIIVSLVLAAWFTDLRLKLRFQGFFKTVIYMPNLIMASAFAMLFFTLFSNAETGPINSIPCRCWCSPISPL